MKFNSFFSGHKTAAPETPKAEIFTASPKINEDEQGFLAALSQEIRTPLTFASNQISQILEETPAGSETYARLQNIAKQHARVSNVLDTVITAQQVASGKLSTEVLPYKFNKWVSGELEKFKPRTEDKALRISVSLDPTVETALFDADKLSLVMENMLTAAYSESPMRGSIAVSTYVTEGGMVRFAVADENLAGKDSAGSLALLYSAKIVEQLGGKAATRRTRNGSEYSFEIPSCVEAVQAPAPAEPEYEAPGTEEPSHFKSDEPEIETVGDISNATILVVEDDYEMQDYVKDALSDACKRVLTASNGVEGLKVLENEEVDVIVSDVMMPEMDGFAFCHRVKTSVSISHIPIILLTARSDENSRILGYKNGADDYITKPFDINNLLNSINRLFLKRELIRRQYATVSPLPEITKTTFSSADEEFLDKFEALVRSNITDPDLDIQTLVDGMGISRTVLFNKVKQLTGLNLQNYVNKMRMEYVIELMRNPDLSLGEIAERSGFSSPRYFSTSFKNYTGMTPSQYKREKL